MSKELDVFNEIIDKFAEQMMRANKESLTTINKTNAIEYLYRTPQVILLQEALQRLKSIENSNPSEALECLEDLRQECKSTYFDENGKQWWTTDKNKDYRCNTIKQALLKLDRYEKILGSGRLTDRNYKNTTLPLDSCKPYLRLGQLEDIYEEAKKNE